MVKNQGKNKLKKFLVNHLILFNRAIIFLLKTVKNMQLFKQ